MIETSKWIIVDDYCAVRIVSGGNINNIADRVAFIEKSPRVRIEEFDHEDIDFRNWHKGQNGSGGTDPEKNGYYGFDQESRDWCDAMLRKLGYLLPEDKSCDSLLIIDRCDDDCPFFSESMVNVASCSCCKDYEMRRICTISYEKIGGIACDDECPLMKHPNSITIHMKSGKR